MNNSIVVLRIYRTTSSERDVEEELKKLGEFLKTRSQLVSDVEYITTSKISSGDVKGLIIIKSSSLERASSEAHLITTLVKSNFKTLDVEEASDSLIRNITIGLKNFF